MPQRRYALRLWTTADLDSGATLESDVIDCRTSDPEGLMLRITHASGAPSLDLEVAFSNDGVTFNSYDTQAKIVDASATEWATSNPQDYHMVSIPWAPFIKLRITELGVLADNVIDGVLWMTEL